ncbi:Xin actin-binding repeat-containing protein 2 [Lemmus lemmus]
MARYQAAVSRGDTRSFSANVMEDSEVCTVPGGLAKMKKQFEKDEMTSTSNAFSEYQYHHQSRSEQEAIHSSQEMRKNEQEVYKAHGTDVFKTEMMSRLEKHTEEVNQASQLRQYVQETVIDTPEDEEMPKVSTKILKEQFEKSAQEKFLYSDRETTTPSRCIKIENDSEESLKPSSAVGTSSSYTSTSQRKETSTSSYSNHSVISTSLAQVNGPPSGKTEEFTPPPPDVLQTPVDRTAFSQSPEFPSPPRGLPIPKDLYTKQRNLYELNRLYRHIHPELRKNLEKDYISEVSEIVSSQINSGNSVSADVQQARYIFENTNDSSQRDLKQESLEWDEILKGEVQSMRWIFENQPLDSIKNGSADEGSTFKGTSDQELIAGGDVKYTTWMFETQPMDALGVPFTGTEENTEKIPELARGDVYTARWMFETRPLDSMNKIHQSQEETAYTAINDLTGGDVKTVRYMFETQNLDQLGQLHSVDEVHLLQLRSELKEIKGNVKRSIKCFETQPLYVIRDGSGQMLEIKTVQREDTERGDVRTARWMFETQPLDTISKDITEIKVVRGISMEENVKGGVSRAKWLFETQPLENIKEESDEVVIKKEAIIGTDVSKKCWMFETQPLDILKEVPDADTTSPEERIGGDVKTTKHLFETFPIEALKDSPDIGKLQKITASEEEKGDVKHQKLVFETQPLEDIREEKTRTEFENFPSLPLPPPPVDEKSGELLSASLLPPPPPTPWQAAQLLPPSALENHSAPFRQQTSQTESLGSGQIHSQVKTLTGKTPPPTLPKPKLPQRIKDKISQQYPNGELAKSVSDMEMKTILPKDEERSVVAMSSEHTEAKQEVFRESLGERKQLSTHSANSLSQRVPETSALRGKQTAPLVKSHSFPSGSEQQSPKPYMRKFKTPLMIAEEKYRQQREELEKQRQENSCHSTVKTETYHQNISEKEKETVSQKAAETVPIPRKDLDLTKNRAVLAGVSSDSQLSTASALAVATERLQHVLAASEDKCTMRKEGIQSSKDMQQSKSACEISQNYKECKTQQTLEQHMETLPFPQSKSIFPSFKVKTIKLPTLDHTSTEIDLSSESHIKQSEVDAQTITKQMNQEIKKTQAKIQCDTKQSVPEKSIQLPKTEKTVTIQMPEESSGKNHKSKLKTSSKRQRGFGELDRGNVLGREESSQDSSVSNSKEDRSTDKKQKHLQDQRVPRVVQQTIFDACLDTRAQNFQQTQIQTSGSTVAHKKRTDVTEKKCLRDKGIQQTHVTLNTEDSKQEIIQNKYPFSSVKESQQNDGKCAINILEFLRKREELQQILSRVKQFEAESNKSGLQTFQTLLNIVPVWLISKEQREYGVRVAMENNLEKVKEEITHIKTQAEDMLVHCEHIIQTAMMASQTVKQRDKPTHLNEMSLKVSKANASSNKCTEERENKIGEEKLSHHQVAMTRDQENKIGEEKLSHHQVTMTCDQENKIGEEKLSHHQVTMMRDQENKIGEEKLSHHQVTMTRDQENKIGEEKLSHHQVAMTHYPAETHQEPKGGDSKIAPPSLKIRSPSPTFITIESTARRAEASTKSELSQSPEKNSCTEPPPRRPTEQTSRLHRTGTSPSPPRSRSEQLVRLKDTTARLARGSIPCSPGTPVPTVEKRSEVIMSPATLRRQIKIESHARDSPPTITIPVNVNHAVSGSFRESVEAQEERRKTEKKETYVHKDEMNSINSTMPEMESYDAVEIIRKVQGPRLSEQTERFEAATNQTVQMAERFLNSHENEINRWFREFENDPVFGAKTDRRAYANGEINRNMKQETHTFCKEEFGLGSSGNANFPAFSYRHPREHQETVSAMQPGAHSEARSLSEHFLGMDAFDSQIIESKVATSLEAGRSGFDIRHAPPTYEDVIAGHSLDLADSPTNHRRDFQKMWQESERVFKRLGYETSNTHATEMSRAFQEESAFIRETAGPRQGNLHNLSKDSLSNGMPGSRQAEFS